MQRERLKRLVLIAMLLAFAPGCTRKFFRTCADDDVTGVLTQKNVFPEWKVENWHAYPDPRARYADLSNPDRPTFPPDDFASYRLSPNPQNPTKKVGVGRVDGDGYLKVMAAWDIDNQVQASLERANEKNPVTPATPAAEKLPLPVPVESPSDARIPSVQPGPLAAVSLPASVGPRMTEPSDHGVPETPVKFESTVEPWQATPKAVTPSPAPTAPVLDKLGGLTFPARQVVDPPMTARAQAEPSPVDVAARPEDYMKVLATNMQGYKLTMDQCVELGVFNSREFQDQREALYNAALPVTLERYQFAAQAFFAETVVRQNLGSEAGGPLDTWRIGTDTSVSKLFPTGGNLIVRLANQFVVDLTNGAPYAAVSNLSLTLSQPLLRGGGFAVTLEPLTQAERTLLYAIRSYARYRKLFYVAIAAGGSYTNNPYGLAGLSVNLGRGIGGNLTAPSVGFLPTIADAAVIANQEKNILALQQLLRLYQAFREGGQQSDLQVGQVEQELITRQSQLLGSSIASTTGGSAGSTTGIRGYLDGLDSYKLQLGLPMTVGLNLESSPLKPIRQQLSRFEAVYADLQQIETEARKFDPLEPVARFRPRWQSSLTDSPLAKETNFGRTIRGRWDTWSKLSDDQIVARIATLQDERRKLFDRKTDRELKGEPENSADSTRILTISAEVDLASFEQALRVYEAQPWMREKGAVQAAVQAAAFRDVFNTFYQLILEVRNDRLAQIRGQWPKLPGVNLEGSDLIASSLDEAYTVGIQTALSQRLDLMNMRGQVVDSFRQVKVRANALQGVLDVRYDLDSVTPDAGGNPFAFSMDRAEQRLTINAELPLVRRSERNAYRSALITYQAGRRRLMAFEDNIANDVRADLRELRVLAEQYRLQQRLIELGYSQVDNAQAILIAPPAPGAQNDAGSAAALTQQVLQAQNRLLTAQNDLYNLWVNYLVSRMQFYLDVEAMNLDSRGLWLDESSPIEVPAVGASPAPERLTAPRP